MGHPLYYIKSFRKASPTKKNADKPKFTNFVTISSKNY